MNYGLVIVFLALLTAEVAAQTVQDGDSIIRGDGVRGRLYGIDAPEKDQPYGREARKVLKQYMPLVAKMKEYDEDRYGRLIVELFTEDNKSINAAMICSGAAWWNEYTLLTDHNLSSVRKMLRRTGVVYGLKRTL